MVNTDRIGMHRNTLKRESLRLFFSALAPAMAVVIGLLGWKYAAGEVPQVVFYIAYGLVVACALVCVYAVVRYYIAHFGDRADAT
jgi:hypothetical protein